MRVLRVLPALPVLPALALALLPLRAGAEWTEAAESCAATADEVLALEQCDIALASGRLDTVETVSTRANRAMLLSNAGRGDEALAEIEAAIGIEANLPYFHSIHGRVLHGLGRMEDAIAAFERALEKAADPANAEIIKFGNSTEWDASFMLAVILADLGRMEEGAPHAARAFALDPDEDFAGWLYEAYGLK